MEDRNDNKVSNGEVPLQNVSFSSVTSVATEWMFDFVFVSLCRHFKEGKLEEFNELISTFQVLSKSPSLKSTGVNVEKTMICAFLSRVMHGEHLDVSFDEDESVTPLMSAAKLWSSLKSTVVDDSVFDNITVLLVSQAVAVCLKEGQRCSAPSVFKWLEKNIECPQKLLGKLSKIVAEMDTYHPFLMSFSFSRLLDAVQSFLEAFLQKNPSDYLLKAATEMVQSSHDIEELEDVKSQHISSTETTNGSHKKRKRSKMKLLPIKSTAVWIPDSTKKLCVSLKRVTTDEIAVMRLDTSVNNSDVYKRRRTRKKWTYQLDKYLKHGVRHYGVGKWSHILMHYDFEGRTATMLKDRWRVLQKKLKGE